MMDGVEYGFCISYAPCSSFTNVWNFAFQVNFMNGGNANYINVPISSFAYDYADSENTNLQFCQIYVEYLDPAQPQSN